MQAILEPFNTLVTIEPSPSEDASQSSERRRLFASHRLTSLLVAFLIALTAAPSMAQEAEAGEGAADEEFFEVVDVEIANIDVWVTDKQGNPVQGLTRDDFVVIQDGTPTKISNFYAVSDGRPVAGQIAPPPSADPDSPRQPSLDLSQAAKAEPDLALEHRLWVIVFIDNYNIVPLERNRVFPAIRQFLGRTLRSQDQAMLVTYSRSLKVRQPFTRDFSLIVDSLDEIEDDVGLASLRRRDQAEALRRIDNSDSANQALLYARNYAEEQMNGVDYTVDALERLLESLGGLPGRKALVHVSSGIPMLAGEEMFHAVAEKFDITSPFGEIPRHDTTRSFERINRHANAHRVSFYTVDAGGLRGMQFGNAEYGGFVDARLRITLDSVVPENLQAPLRFMALETGGRAIVNQNEILPALEEASQDFSSFYSLGIASTGTDLGRYHKVEVKLRERRKGVRLRHRAGYRSKTADTRVRESLRSALLYFKEDNPDGVTVVWGRPEPHGDKGHYLLPIQLNIPLRDVVLLPTRTGQHELRLQLYVGAAGDEGELSEIDTAPLGLRLAEQHVEAAKNESLVHTHKLLLSPGLKRVGVAIHDLIGRDTSVVTRSMQVGPATEKG
ncbi:MAG: VWA domain-containing protein [Acidobacteriota bacterium]